MDEAKEYMLNQLLNKNVRSWPNGRIGPDDDGQIACALGYDKAHDVLMFNFGGKAITWLAMPKDQCILFRDALTKFIDNWGQE